MSVWFAELRDHAVVGDVRRDLALAQIADEAGHDEGGKAWGRIASLVETAQFNGVDPQAWLADTIARIPDYKITKVDALMRRPAG